MSRNRPSLEDDEALARELQEQFAAEFRQSQQQQQTRRSGTNGRDDGRGGPGGPGPGAGAGENSASWSARRGAGQPPAAATAPTIAAIPDVRSSRHGASARVRASARGSHLPPPEASRGGVPGRNAEDEAPAAAKSGEDYVSRLERAFRDEDRAAALQNSSHHRRSEIPRASDPDGSSFPAGGYDRKPPSRNPSYTSAPNASQPPAGLSSLSSHSRGAVVDADEEYARRLQNEIRMEEAARSSRGRRGDRHLGGGGSSHGKASPGIETPATLSDDVSEMTSDEEMARRVEQELRDEELARRLASQEQARLSERRAQHIQAVSVSRTVSPKCSVRRALSYIVPSLVLIGVVVGVLLYFTVFNQEIPFFPTPQDFQNEDPFNAKNASEVDKWRTQGEVGLTLEVVSALESIWLPYFETAVFQWDNGSPDALTLTKTYEAHQSVCDPVNYKLIVCNGNYGDTRWRGINKILLADGFIFASTAKMNEYYFTGSSDTEDQRQYTMCHEMGHGFGLPHTDESFTNSDLGNCMDYTNNPRVNKQPDETNYRFLEELYGDVPGSGNGTTASSENVNGRLRHRRRLHGALFNKPIPAWVLSAWRSMDDELNNHARGAEFSSTGKSWRVLHQSELGEAHETDIGGGYTIQVHKLF